MKSLTFSALLSTVAVGLVAAPAQASLIGDSIDYSFGLNNGATFLSGSAIVTDSGAEYDDSQVLLVVTLNGSYLT